MEHFRIKDLKKGEKKSISLYVESVTEELASNQTYYQKATVKDLDGFKVIMMNFYNGKQDKKISAKTIVDAVVECGEYQGKLTYTIKAFEPTKKELNSSNFKPKSEINLDETWKNICKLINTIKDDVILCKLASKTLSRELVVFKTAPLTASDEYARVGGLMEATYKLMQMADNCAMVLGLDRNLMVAAASVYYIGSVNMVDDEYLPTKEVALTGFDIASHDKLVETRNIMEKNGDTVDDELFEIFDNIVLSRYMGKPTATVEAFAMKMLDSAITVVERGKKLSNTLNEGEFRKENELRMWYKRTMTPLDSEVVA